MRAIIFLNDLAKFICNFVLQLCSKRKAEDTLSLNSVTSLSSIPVSMIRDNVYFLAFKLHEKLGRTM